MIKYNNLNKKQIYYLSFNPDGESCQKVQLQRNDRLKYQTKQLLFIGLIYPTRFRHVIQPQLPAQFHYLWTFKIQINLGKLFANSLSHVESRPDIGSLENCKLSAMRAEKERESQWEGRTGSPDQQTLSLSLCGASYCIIIIILIQKYYHLNTQ